MENRKKIEYHDENGYLMVKINFRWTASTIRLMLDEAKKEIIKRGYKKILIDLTFWDKPDTEMTRFITGEYLAKAFRPPYKLSAFANSSMINRFAENTAVNRGTDFRVFSNKDDALRWLLKKE